MFNLEKLVRKNILELKTYSSARDDYKGNEGVFLDANENPFGKFNRYPDPYQSVLKKKIGGLKGVATPNIFVGNGSDEAIDLVYRIFCDPSNSRALTFTPTYGMYEVSAAINDVQLLTQPLDEKFQLNKQNLLPLLADPLLKVIFVCSPNNPTGNTIDDIAFLLENFSGIVVVDEAYIDFSTRPSWIKNLTQYPNLIVLQTFSKAWGLASARIGMAFAHENIIALFNKVKPPYNISSFNQKVAIEALSKSSIYKQRLNTILRERTLLLKNFETLPFIKRVYSTDANFVLINIEDATTCYNYLIREKVIVRNRSSVIDDCLRITIGTQRENNILFKTLKKYADEKSTIYR